MAGLVGWRFRDSGREGPVMMIVSPGDACGRAGLRWWARLRGHLDILRLMTLGLTRNRRLFNLCRIWRSCFGDGGSQPVRGKRPPGR